MALSGLMRRAFRALGRSSASATDFGDVMADSLRPLGELTKSSPGIPENSLLSSGMDSKKIKQALHNQIDNTVYENWPSEFGSLEPADNLMKTYKRELGRLYGGDAGLRELTLNLPVRLRTKLEGAIGEFSTRLADDVEPFIQSIDNMGGFTPDNLSLKNLTAPGSVMSDHFKWLDDGLKEITRDFIKNNKRYDSWEDFQRINWNDHIMDSHTNLVREIEGASGAEQDLLRAALNDFKKENVIVMKQGELVRPDYLNMLHRSARKDLEFSGVDNVYVGEVHYLAKNGDKYAVELTSMRDANLQPLKKPTTSSMFEGYAHEGRWHEGLPPDELNIPPERVRHMNLDSLQYGKLPYEDIREMERLGMDKTASMMQFNITPVSINRNKRFTEKFGDDILNAPGAGGGPVNLNQNQGTLYNFNVKKSAQKDVENWIMGESNNQTNEFMNALRLFDFGSEGTAYNMSPNSLGLFGAIGRKSVKRTEDAVRLGQDLGYTGKRNVFQIEQTMNDIGHRQKTPIREIDTNVFGVKNLDKSLWNARMDGYIELNPVRRTKRGLERVAVGKNITVDNYFQGMNVHKGTRDVMEDAISKAIKLAEQGETITIGNLQKMGQAQNPALKRNLPFVNSLVKSLGDNPSGKMAKFLPEGKTPESFIDELVELVAEEEVKFKRGFGENASLFVDFGYTKFDDAGDLVGNLDLAIRHSGVSVGNSISADRALTKLPAIIGPILPGMKFTLGNKDKSGEKK